MNKNLLCPQCNGKGTVATTMTEWGKPESAKTCEMTCPTCDGAKQIPAKEHKAFRREEARLASNTCQHPIDKWVHGYDPKSRLGDFYNCGLCGELTQVG